MIVDSHCHLSSPEIYADLDNIIRRAHEAGVDAFLNAGAKFDEFDIQLEICKRFQNVWCATGVHPHDAVDYQHISADDVLKNTHHDKVIAIGECGLDYFYDFAPKDVQIKVFSQMIKAAQQSGLPLIVHTRQADEDTITLITDAYRQKPFRGVIHCYSSSFKLAQEMLKIGFYISVSGIMTFKNSEDLRQSLQKIPLERLLVETDTPYLAPIPMRGQTNEPSLIVYTLRMLSELRGLDFKKISDITSKNFFDLFDKARIIT